MSVRHVCVPGAYQPHTRRVVGLLAALAVTAFLLVHAAGAWAVGAYVQTTKGTGSSGTTLALTAFVGAVATGNTIIVSAGAKAATMPVLTVSDNMGNTYSIASGPTGSAAVGAAYIYYAKNVTGGAGLVVTVTSNVAVTKFNAIASEYSGLAAGTPLDKSAAVTGTGNSPASGNTAATTQATETIIGLIYDSFAVVNVTISAPYTERNESDGVDTMSLSDKNVAATGAQSFTAGLGGGTHNWHAHVATFKAEVVPNAPSALTATAVSSTQINLSWTQNSTDETSFKIERKTGAGAYVQIGTTAANVTTYSDSTGLSANTTYTYQVRASNAAGNSAYSPSASATTFPIASFNVVQPAANAVTGMIFTKVAGTNFAVDIVALSATNTLVTTFTGAVLVEVVDNTTGGACSGLPLIGAFTNQTFAAGDLGRHVLTSPNTIANSYQNAKIRIKYPTVTPTVTSCSTDNFAIRPSTFTFTVMDANRTTAGATVTLNNSAILTATVHNAGRPFRIAATAFNGAGTPATTTNYNGTPTAVLTVCGGTACTATTGTLTMGAFSAAAGVVTSTTASYNDVGAFNLQVVDATYAAVDAADGSSAAQLTITSTAAAAGRFVPDHFVVSASSITPRSDIAACSASSFNYMGERMDAVFTLSATAFPTGTTTRYAGTLGRLVLTTPASFSFGAVDGITPLTARLDTSLGTSGTWTNGAATVTGILSMTRLAAPDGPYSSFKLGIAPSDPDTVILDPTLLTVDADASGSSERAQVGGSIGMRFGRLRLQNAAGSQLIASPVPIEAQYWNGTAFATNTLDNCTSITTANVSLGNYQKNLAGGETTASVGGLFSAGVGTLRLSAPGAANNGSVDVSINLSAVAAGASCTAGMAVSTALSKTYLQGKWCGATFVSDPTARVTFGLLRAPGNVIYRRENF